MRLMRHHNGDGQLLGDVKYVKESAYFDITADIELGKGTIVSDDVMMLTHEHSHYLGEEHLPVEAQSKVICDDVYIGARAILLADCHYVARGVVIGAGSVVTNPITEPNTIWAGNPARKIGERRERPCTEE